MFTEPGERPVDVVHGEHATGRYSEARGLIERSLAHWRAGGNQTPTARTLVTLSHIATTQRDYDRAEALLRDAIQTLRTVGDRLGAVQSLEGFGRLAADTGHAERAMALLGAAAHFRQVFGTPIYPAEQDLLEAALERARTELGERTETVWKRGQAMSFDEAVELALAGSVVR